MSEESLAAFLGYRCLTFTLPFLLDTQKNDVWECTYQTLRSGGHTSGFQRFWEHHTRLNVACHVASFVPGQENLRLWRDQHQAGALVALESTVGKLSLLTEGESITQIHPVEYVDMLSQPLPFEALPVEGASLFDPQVLLFKDHSYRHEGEIRVFLSPIQPRPPQEKRLLKVDVAEVCTGLRVSPFASGAFFAELQKKLHVQGMDLPTRWSDYAAGLHMEALPQSMHKDDSWFGFMGLPLGEGEAFPLPPQPPIKVSPRVQELLDELVVLDEEEGT